MTASVCLGSWVPRTLNRHGRPGSRRIRSLAAVPMAVRLRRLSFLSWIAANVAATFVATSWLKRWLCSRCSGRSLPRAAY